MARAPIQKDVQLYDLPSPNVREIDRLEYGMFCQFENGPIEVLAEHQQLGQSDGFPQDLIQFCYPSKIGITSSAFDEMPPDCAHGTVLRPITLSSGAVSSIMCRIGRRSEEGEQYSGRMYTLGRYITSGTCDIDPLILWNTMNRYPLSAITREQVKEGLRPLQVPPTALESPDPNHIFKFGLIDEYLNQARVIEKFLSKALVNILSGIPIAIADTISEENFFYWVSALWRLLHPSLRPYLSAGWGVASFLSGRLTVTYAASRAENCAVFSPIDAEGANEDGWSRPAKVYIYKGSELNKKDFSETRETPGSIYVHYFYHPLPKYVRDASGFDRAASPERLQHHFSHPLPPSQVSGHPDFLDRNVVRAFRYPGLRVFDHYRLRLLREWLSKNGSRIPLTDVKQLTYEDYMIKGIGRAIEAIRKDRSRKKGEQVLLDSLERRQPNSHAGFYNQAKDRARRDSGISKERLHLFFAVSEGNSTEALKELVETMLAGEAHNLPPKAVKLIHSHLDNGLSSADKTWLELNKRILCEKPEKIALVYSDWLKQNDNDFALVLTMLEQNTENFQEVLDEIQKQTEKAPSTVLAFQRLLKGEPPTAQDVSAINSVSQDLRYRFSEMLRSRWNHIDNRSKNRRETILPWIRAFPPTGPYEKPSLALAVQPDERTVLETGKTFSPDTLVRLANEIEEDRIPDLLLSPIAALALLRWNQIGERIRKNVGKWKKVTSLWPMLVQRALLGDRNVEGEKKCPFYINEAVNDLTMTVDQADELLGYWAARENLTPNVAQLIWMWAGNSNSHSLTIQSDNDAPRSSIAKICQLFQGRLSNVKGANEKDIDRAVRIAELAGEAKRIRPQLDDLWEAEKDGLKLRYYLSLFPKKNFEPNYEHLNALIKYRKWLCLHVQGNPSREKKFRIATLEPQYALYPGSAGVRWDGNYKETDLWFVFKGVPAELQGNLRKALESYSKDDIEKAEWCVAYLRVADSPRDSNTQVMRVVRAFLREQASRNRIETWCDAAEKEVNPRPDSWLKSALYYLVPILKYTTLGVAITFTVATLFLLAEAPLIWPLDWIVERCAFPLWIESAIAWTTYLIFWCMHQLMLAGNQEMGLDIQPHIWMLLKEMVKGNRRKLISRALDI